jgi:hypothetical protein
MVPSVVAVVERTSARVEAEWYSVGAVFAEFAPLRRSVCAARRPPTPVEGDDGHDCDARHESQP